MGRPSIFTEDLADSICEHIAQGGSLVGYCKQDDTPGYTTIMRWLQEDISFRENYTRAREAQADYLAEEILAISDYKAPDYTFDPEHGLVVDGDHIQRARLRVDTRKWYAGKVQPKKYSDKQIISGDAENPVQHNHAGKVDMGAELIAGAIDRILGK